MKIAVCVKQVPDSGIVSIDPETHTLQRKSAGAVLNPLDEFPIEAALRFKDGIGAHVTVLSMGPPRAEEILARAIAMGADDGILLSDACFAGSDTWATSLILSEALRKYGPFDIVFCGKQAIDGDTAQVGPAIAAHLGWAQAASVSHIEIPSEKNVSEISLTRLFENGCDDLTIPLPAVIMVLKEACEPRFGTLKGRINYFRKGIRKYGQQDLGMDKSSVGLKGSPTRVVKTSIPEMGRRLRKIEGKPEEQARELAEIIRARLQD